MNDRHQDGCGDRGHKEPVRWENMQPRGHRVVAMSNTATDIPDAAGLLIHIHDEEGAGRLCVRLLSVYRVQRKNFGQVYFFPART